MKYIITLLTVLIFIGCSSTKEVTVKVTPPPIKEQIPVTYTNIEPATYEKFLESIPDSSYIEGVAETESGTVDIKFYPKKQVPKKVDEPADTLPGAFETDIKPKPIEVKVPVKDKSFWEYLSDYWIYAIILAAIILIIVLILRFKKRA